MPKWGIIIIIQVIQAILVKILRPLTIWIFPDSNSKVKTTERLSFLDCHCEICDVIKRSGYTIKLKVLIDFLLCKEIIVVDLRVPRPVIVSICYN